MSVYTNESGQPVSFPVDNWKARELPPRAPMSGRYCRLEMVDVDKHAEDLFAAFILDSHHANWTYLPYGPFTELALFREWLASAAKANDPLFHTVIDLNTGKAVGLASYLRINPGDGVIETGHIHYSPLLQRTAMATETMYLMMKRAFDELGYRRYEWKCDALNAPSKKAAMRLGFEFEGTFRQLTMYKGRNRDTAWYAIIDKDWPIMKARFERWLSPENFDRNGQQICSLRDI